MSLYVVILPWAIIFCLLKTIFEVLKHYVSVKSIKLDLKTWVLFIHLKPRLIGIQQVNDED